MVGGLHESGPQSAEMLEVGKVLKRGRQSVEQGNRYGIRLLNRCPPENDQLALLPCYCDLALAFVAQISSCRAELHSPDVAVAILA